MLAAAPASTTVHAIGRCPVKGCRARRRNTFPGLVRTDRRGTWTEWGIPTEAGLMSAHCTFGPPRLRYAAERDIDRMWGDAMLNVGWVCTDHDLFMTIAAVQGVYRADKPCTARCQSATGPSCECVCGGEQHGARWG